MARSGHVAACAAGLLGLAAPAAAAPWTPGAYCAFVQVSAMLSPGGFEAFKGEFRDGHWETNLAKYDVPPSVHCTVQPGAGPTVQRMTCSTEMSVTQADDWTGKCLTSWTRMTGTTSNGTAVILYRNPKSETAVGLRAEGASGSNITIAEFR